MEPPTLESPTPQFPISTPQSPLPTPQSPLPTHPTPPLRLSKHNIVDTLLQELQQCDPQKRQKIIWELGQRGDSRAVQPLVDLLLDSDSRQQSLILSALSEIGTRTLKPMSRALALSLQNENADVRKNAIRDVTRIYDLVAQISQLLHSAAEDPDTEVQATAQWALGKVNRIKAAPPESLN
ncbi:HEAT repeat domain-containing protein [Alkalinema sp. FACHB-956]|nr:HEAT repeat domain-containing protein [Alkalinema sp. FACHB-956]